MIDSIKEAGAFIFPDPSKVVNDKMFQRSLIYKINDLMAHYRPTSKCYGCRGVILNIAYLCPVVFLSISHVKMSSYTKITSCIKDFYVVCVLQLRVQFLLSLPFSPPLPSVQRSTLVLMPNIQETGSD